MPTLCSPPHQDSMPNPVAAQPGGLGAGGRVGHRNNLCRGAAGDNNMLVQLSTPSSKEKKKQEFSLRRRQPRQANCRLDAGLFGSLFRVLLFMERRSGTILGERGWKAE